MPSCRGAGTEANAYCVLYGKEGSSGLLPLFQSGSPFARGATSTFFVDVAKPLGTLQKARGHPLDSALCPVDRHVVRVAAHCSIMPRLIQAVIGHDNSGMNPAWHVDFMEVQDIHSGECWLFEVGKSVPGASLMALVARSAVRSKLCRYVCLCGLALLQLAHRSAAIRGVLVATSGDRTMRVMSSNFSHIWPHGCRRMHPLSILLSLFI